MQAGSGEHRQSALNSDESLSVQEEAEWVAIRWCGILQSNLTKRVPIQKRLNKRIGEANRRYFTNETS